MVEGARDAQYTRGVGSDGHIDDQAFLLAQALEALRDGLPQLDRRFLGQRPVGVHTAARRHQVGRAEFVQACALEKLEQRVRRFLLGVVAVHVDEQRLDEAGVGGLAPVLRVFERGQGEVDVTRFLQPPAHGGLDLLQRLNEDVLLLFGVQLCDAVVPVTRQWQNLRQKLKRFHGDPWKRGSAHAGLETLDQFGNPVGGQFFRLTSPA